MNFRITFLTLIPLFLGNIQTATNSFGGSWCPYREESLVQCRVRNGSEFYMSTTPLCSKHGENCVQRVLRRPKFITTYKKVTETKYKCCPTFMGSDCQIECLNCSSFKSLEVRVEVLEKRLKRTEDKKESETPKILSTETLDVNSVNIDDNGHAGLERTIRRLQTNLRNLDFRLEAVEREMWRMTEVLDKPRARSAGPEYEVIQNEGDRGGVADQGQDLAQDLVTSFKILENNLGRGDIASTLNDDYGEDKETSQQDYQDELKPTN